MKKVIQVLISDKFSLSVITLNTLTLILDGFPSIHSSWGQVLGVLDFMALAYFIAEAILKIKTWSWNNYWADGWNRFDFCIVIIGLPLLLVPVFPGLEILTPILVLRQLRFLRILRVMHFIPNADKLWKGVVRALKASVEVFTVLFCIIIILGMINTMLYGQIAPEYFSNPLHSMYSTFKIFTVEGWYEIPDTLASGGLSAPLVGLTRLYFVLLVLAGGILGLSIANAVFVDEMTMDNNNELEDKIDRLIDKIDALGCGRDEE